MQVNIFTIQLNVAEINIFTNAWRKSYKVIENYVCLKFWESLFYAMKLLFDELKVWKVISTMFTLAVMSACERPRK